MLHHSNSKKTFAKTLPRNGVSDEKVSEPSNAVADGVKFAGEELQREQGDVQANSYSPDIDDEGHKARPKRCKAFVGL